MPENMPVYHDCQAAGAKATLDQLSQAIGSLSIGIDRDLELIRRNTHHISYGDIPWSQIQALHIIGRKNSRCNFVLALADFSHGAYINDAGTCLLIIHPKESLLQTLLDRASDRLDTLAVYNAALVSLDVTSISSLTQLVLWQNSELSSINGLEKHTGLTRIHLYECDSLCVFPDLRSFTRLTDLRLIDCDQLTELPGLDSLSELTFLILSGCRRIMKLPKLVKLSKLSVLTISGCTGLTAIPDLDKLISLTDLDCEDSGILFSEESKFPPHLKRLDLSSTTVSQIPASILELKSLRWLGLNNLTLTSVPAWLPDIAEKFSVEQYNHAAGENKAIVSLYNTNIEDADIDISIFEQPYDMVVEWFDKHKQGKTQPLNEIKVVFLGDGEAGKSHTIARLMNDGGDPVDYTDQSTPGIVIKRRKYDVDGHNFRVNYWDFGGQEIMHSMHRIFLTNRTMYVVLLNARDDTQGDRAQYWLHNIQSFAPDAPVLLVMNKIDMNPKASVDERTLRSRYPRLTRVVRLSALEFSQERFNREFTDILLDEIRKSGSLEVTWPASWIAVKERLENMRTHYILGPKYKQICQECQVNDVQAELLHWFNDLGVSFCFRDKDDYTLRRHVILRPDWITNGLYIILFNECQGAENGLIPHTAIYDLLERASDDPSIRRTDPNARYDQPGDVEYVLGVMRKFQLSLNTGDNREFIPMLCKQDSTVDLHYYEKDADTLEFRMEFDYLPDNLLHRLMVERHAELDMSNVWRKGARFQLHGTGLSAVLVIDGNTLKFFVRHTDPMHRSNTYLTILKANADRIWRRMGLQEPEYQLVYKLDNKIGTFDYEELRQAREDGETTVYSKTWRKKIRIEDILNQSAPEGLEDERKLLEKVLISCRNIQGERDYRISRDEERNKGLEDKRNRRVRDNLENWGYIVKDQPQYGVSGTGKSVGELDLLVYDEQRKPWTVIEALRINSYATSDWNDHLDKLLYNYNFFGSRSLYLLTYVDCARQDFGGIWTAFKAHIQGHNSTQFAYESGSFVDLNDPQDPHLIKKSKCRYNCGGEMTTVYHIFMQIDLP